MRLNWAVDPLIVYTVVAAGTFVSLMLFLAIKVEVAKLRRLVSRLEQPRAIPVALEETVSSTAAELHSLKTAVRQAAAALPSRGVHGINLNKRTLAVRMHRRGEPISRIAAALKMPRNEIELLLKLSEMAGPAEMSTAVVQ